MTSPPLRRARVEHPAARLRAAAAARAKRITRRIARLIWLAWILFSNDRASQADYCRRFGVSAWTYRREARKLRMGLYIWAAVHGDYKTIDYLDRTR